MKISAVVIAFNEERNIERCLASLAFADEIVVVDSGSTDRTVELSRRYTERVSYRAWTGHIDQKNHALSLCSNDWVISLDADEEVSPELRAELARLKQSDNPAVGGYAIPRLTWYIDSFIRHSGWYPARRIRFFDRRRSHWGGVNPHDTVIVDGATADLRGDIFHYSFNSIGDHLRTIESFTTIAARELFERGVRTSILEALARSGFMFFKSYLLQQGFRDGFNGLLISYFSAVHVFTKYVKLLKLCRTNQN